MWILSIVNRARALATVARLAKWLQVPNHIAATLHDRHNMVGCHLPALPAVQAAMLMLGT